MWYNYALYCISRSGDKTECNSYCVIQNVNSHGNSCGIGNSINFCYQCKKHVMLKSPSSGIHNR